MVFLFDEWVKIIDGLAGKSNKYVEFLLQRDGSDDLDGLNVSLPD